MTGADTIRIRYDRRPVCPRCARSDALDIAAPTTIRSTANSDREWFDTSSCRCAACGWAGTMKDASITTTIA
jgi:Zn ribbon nucleic-acid-binding protein